MNPWPGVMFMLGIPGLAVGGVMVGLVAAGPPPVPIAVPTDIDFSPRALRKILSLSPLPEVPPDPTSAVADDPAAARLGQFLFFDQRLSSNGAVSCATCHDPAHGFADGRQLAQGVGQEKRHTPALWNVGYNRWFFWDGRADTLWAQAIQPIESPIEQGATRLQCAHVVSDDAALRGAYEAIFGPMPPLDDADRFPPEGRPVPDEPDHPHHVAWMTMTDADRDAVNRVYSNLTKAIAAYERRLVSRAAPFDRFVEGLRTGDPAKLAALDPAAQRGLALFVGRANCHLCHFGPNFTDGEFHSTGIAPLGGGEPWDPGRYDGLERLRADPFNATGPYAEPAAAAGDEAREKVNSVVRGSEAWGQFKTPSLRNVERTPPYMHQGQLATLEDVLRHYSTLEDAVLPGHHREQLLVAVNLSAEEIDDVRAFLRSLTDESIDPDLMRAPSSPEFPARRP